MTKPLNVIIIAVMNLSLKNLRESIGMSQKQLAISIGIGQSRYANYETGYRRMSAEIAYKILDFAKLHGIEASLEDIYPRIHENNCKGG